MDRLWKVMDEDAAGAKPSWRSRTTPYLLALALLAAGVAARIALDPLLLDRAVFLFFIPAVIVGSAGGGFLPGLASTVLGVLAGWILLERYGFVIANQIDAVVFACLGFAIATAGERWLRLQDRATAKTDQLLEREAYLQSILSTVPDAMIVIDAFGIIQSFSPAAERMFGWGSGEMVGQNIKALMPSPHREAHDGYLAHYADTGEQRMIGKGRSEVAVRKDGSVFAVELAIGEMAWGGHKYFTGFVRDISERERSQTRVRELQSELIQISRLSAMGEMAAALAHELNQPLSAIANYLKGGRRLLAAKHPDSEVLEPMDKAAEQSIRAGHIIRRLRSFVVRDHHERSVESLQKLVDEATSLALIGAREKGVRVRLERDPSVDLAVVDKVQVQQVIFNLTRNAIEAMDSANRRELLIAVDAQPEGMAMISVTDTGSGISEEVADRLFQPFVSTKGAEGMGVGLSICRTIIEGHGGRIWTEPNPGGGSIFRFTLPLAQLGETP